MIDDIAFLDDATRPPPPQLEGVTEAQRLPGRHLRMIHDHLRDNMKVIGRLIERASTGGVSSAEIAAETGTLVMVGNFRRYGSLCGQHCEIVNVHHSIEDAAIFPALSEKSAAFRRVSERLAAEHVVVHELLVRLIAALTLLGETPTRENFEATVTLYRTLERVLLSHLGYEEEAIGDALGYFAIGV